MSLEIPVVLTFSRTLNSSTLDLLASFDSLFNSISLGSRILNLDVPPSPRPYFTVLLAYKEAELANGAALIRHGASSALRVTEPRKCDLLLLRFSIGANRTYS